MLVDSPQDFACAWTCNMFHLVTPNTKKARGTADSFRCGIHRAEYFLVPIRLFVFSTEWIVANSQITVNRHTGLPPRVRIAFDTKPPIRQRAALHFSLPREVVKVGKSFGTEDSAVQVSVTTRAERRWWVTLCTSRGLSAWIHRPAPNWQSQG